MAETVSHSHLLVRPPRLCCPCQYFAVLTGQPGESPYGDSFSCFGASIAHLFCPHAKLCGESAMLRFFRGLADGASLALEKNSSASEGASCIQTSQEKSRIRARITRFLRELTTPE